MPRAPTRLLPWTLLLAGCAVGSLPSCRTPEEEARAIAARPGHAVCSVCRCTGDLGCMDVAVGPDTPHADFEGHRYYFCSCDCREEFVRHPADFAGR